MSRLPLPAELSFSATSLSSPIEEEEPSLLAVDESGLLFSLLLGASGSVLVDDNDDDDGGLSPEWPPGGFRPEERLLGGRSPLDFPPLPPSLLVLGGGTDEESPEEDVFNSVLAPKTGDFSGSGSASSRLSCESCLSILGPPGDTANARYGTRLACPMGSIPVGIPLPAWRRDCDWRCLRLVEPPMGPPGLSLVTEFVAGVVDEEEEACGMLGEAGPEGALAEATGGRWEVPGAEEACKPRLDPTRGSGEAW